MLYSSLKGFILVTALLLAVSSVVLLANNRYTAGDARATLLVSEAIITTGGMQLDRYGLEALKSYLYVKEKHGHLYNDFPIGTSLLGIPFVAIAKPFGFKAIEYRDYNLMQIIMAVMSSVITVLLLIRIALEFLSFTNALILSTVFWFGTSLSSTCGTALWSHNLAVVFALLAIFLSIKVTKDNKGGLWAWIGASLFMSYLCRPTMAVLSPFVILYLFSYNKKVAVKTALITGFLLSTLIIYSYYEFSQYLPDYYLPKRLEGGSFYKALYGHLASPSRGLLIYSPFIGVIFMGLLCNPRNIVLKKSWLLIGLVWPLVHLITISRFHDWWAGWSFGPRYMTDVLPGLFLLCIHGWPVSVKSLSSKVFISILAISIIISISIHTGQGLFNRGVFAWNADPNIDRYPDRIFDWKHPQFLVFPENIFRIHL
jgi:hypothetical protein